jgi:hypothetical protein
MTLERRVAALDAAVMKLGSGSLHASRKRPAVPVVPVMASFGQGGRISRYQSGTTEGTVQRPSG